MKKRALVLFLLLASFVMLAPETGTGAAPAVPTASSRSASLKEPLQIRWRYRRRYHRRYRRYRIVRYRRYRYRRPFYHYGYRNGRWYRVRIG